VIPPSGPDKVITYSPDFLQVTLTQGPHWTRRSYTDFGKLEALLTDTGHQTRLLYSSDQRLVEQLERRGVTDSLPGVLADRTYYDLWARRILLKHNDATRKTWTYSPDLGLETLTILRRRPMQSSSNDGQCNLLEEWKEASS